MMNQGEKSEAAKREEEILAFCQREKIFEKSLEKPAPNGDFVFYEGPPTANGKPGLPHLESRAFKDAIPRYKTMRGYRVERRAGWDTHGLPVELEVEKQLGFKGKPDIEKYGVAAFNKKCRESVFAYIDEWARFTKRIGYWVDDTKAYFTLDASYMEGVWSLFAGIAKDGRLYRDYKVVPWCPRCGTALSAHELAQGYQEVKDLTITAKFELVDEPGTYLIAWTTTPWTLPGNVALAVGENIEYVKVPNKAMARMEERSIEKGEVTRHVIIAPGTYVMSKDFLWRNLQSNAGAMEVRNFFEDLDQLNQDAIAFVNDFVGFAKKYNLEVLRGSKLLGKKYKPLYPIFSEEKTYQVCAGDFTTAEDGTGIVHIAPMYGEDDFKLATEEHLPKRHTVGADGRFLDVIDFLKDRHATDEEVAVDIVKDLAARGLLFAKRKYEHSYPFCWRCKTRLIYYARDSWYIRMQDLRGKLSAENKKVHWEPEHIRDGRMGEWLANAKDSATLPGRYRGTPLPVWQTIDGKEQVVIGSVDELKKRTKKSGNKYFVMRHGESENNVKEISSNDRGGNSLTEKGKTEVRTKARSLPDITRIYTSPLLRCRETAEIVATKLKIQKEEIVYDERLREFDFGEFNNRPIKEFQAYRGARQYNDRVPGGESYQDAKNRFGALLYELEQKQSGQNILIVTHGIGFEAFGAVALGADKNESLRLIWPLYAKQAGIRELVFVPLPHNDDFVLDYHLPYLDDIELVSSNGEPLKRIPEVVDCWVESGSMPFAEYHYPFENKDVFH